MLFDPPILTAHNTPNWYGALVKSNLKWKSPDTKPKVFIHVSSFQNIKLHLVLTTFKYYLKTDSRKTFFTETLQFTGEQKEAKKFHVRLLMFSSRSAGSGKRDSISAHSIMYSVLLAQLHSSTICQGTNILLQNYNLD